MKRLVLLASIGILSFGCAARERYVTQKDFQDFKLQEMKQRASAALAVMRYVDTQDALAMKAGGEAMGIFLQFIFRCLDKHGIKVDVAKEWKLFQEELQKRLQPKPRKLQTEKRRE